MVLRDSLIYVAGKVLPSGLAFATSIVLTWLLTPAEYGIYGLGQAIILLGSSVCFEWLLISFLRLFQAHPDPSRCLTTVVVLLAGICGCTAVAFGLVWLAGIAREYQLLLLAALLGTWSYSWFELCSRFQIAQFRPIGYLAMNLLRNVGIFAAGCAIAYVTRSALAVLVAISLAIVIASLVYRLPLGRTAAQAWDRDFAREVLRFGWPVAITLTLFALYSSFSRVMLEALANQEAVGLYTVAITLVQQSIGLVAGGVDSATYSACVRAVEHGGSAAVKMQIEQTWILLFGLVLPASVGLTLVVPNLAAVLVDPAYVPAVVELTPWVAAAALLGSLRTFFFERSLLLANRTRAQVWVMFGAAVTTVGLNYVLIPRYGYLGAAMAVSAGSAVSLVHAIVASRIVFPMPVPAGATAKILAATAVMAAALFGLSERTGTLALGAQLVVGVSAYAATALATDLMGLRRRVSRRLAEALS
jgi:O-antigen/teichoic acid export membrane protein